MTSGPPDATAAVRPLLTVVRGAPTAEQLAALIAVVTASTASTASSASRAVDPARASLWSAPVLRRPLAPGAGAWRSSGLPHS